MKFDRVLMACVRCELLSPPFDSAPAMFGIFAVYIYYNILTAMRCIVM